MVLNQVLDKLLKLSDVAASSAPAKAAPKKKALAESKKPITHPKSLEMIAEAITSLQECWVSSRHAILKYIVKKIKVDEKVANTHLKMVLRAGVKNASLKQSKGSGTIGSFKLDETKSQRRSRSRSS